MTQQLTTEKARELLKQLQYAKAELGQLSVKDEYFKQALEKTLVETKPVRQFGEARQRCWVECDPKEADGFLVLRKDVEK